MSDGIRQIQAIATADTTDLQTGMREARESIGGVGTQSEDSQRQVNRSSSRMSGALGKVAKAAAAAGAAAAVAGAAYAAHLVKQGLAVADAQAKMARQLGLTNEELATLQRAAELAGVSGLERNMERLNRRLGDAAEGGGQAADALERLNLSAQDISELSSEEQLELIGERLQELESHTAKSSVAMDLFGRSGGEMMRLLGNVEGTVGRARQEVETFGTALDEWDTDNIEAANDNISTLGQVTRGMAMEMAATFAPAIIDITDTMIGWAEAIREAGAAQRNYRSAMRATAQVNEMVKDGVDDLTRAELDRAEAQAEQASTELTRQRLRLEEEIAAERREVLDIVGDAEGAEQAINRMMETRTANEQAQLGIVEEELSTLLEQLDAIREQRDEIKARNDEDDGGPDTESLNEYNEALDEYNAARRRANRLASEGLIEEEERLNSVRSAAMTFTEAVIDLGETSRGVFGNTVDFIQELDDQLAALGGDGLQEQLNTLRENMRTQSQVVRDEFEARRETLVAAREQELLDNQEYDTLITQAAREREKRLTEIAAQAAEDRKEQRDEQFANDIEAWFSNNQTIVSAAQQMAGQLTSIFQSLAQTQGNLAMEQARNDAEKADSDKEAAKIIEKAEKKQFEARQNAARASAVVSMAQGVMKVWSQHAANPGIAAALSAGVLAVGAAQLAAINSQSFQGGGSAPSTGSGGGASESAAQAEESPQRTLIVQGDLSADSLYTGETVRRIMDRIAEAQEDGYRVVL